MRDHNPSMKPGINLYPTQIEFIKHAKRIINDESIGIFSSPTGTGKTIALLSSVLSFIKEKDGFEDLGFLNDENRFLLNYSSNNNTLNKVFYCSRTHNQLSHAMRELKRLDGDKNIKAVIIGSRKIFCVNPIVNKSGSIDEINDKCKNLRGIQGERHCKYYKDSDMKYRPLMDIEEALDEGLKHDFCPYYSSKNNVKSADIVFMPYQLLFSEEGRESFEINVEDSIIIIDEAHNLYETLIEIHSVYIPYYFILKFKEKIYWFYKRHQTALRAQSSFILKDILKILDLMCVFGNNGPTKERCVKIESFLIRSKLDDFNMLPIYDFIKENRLIAKITAMDISLSKNFYNLTRFIRFLTLSDENGRIFYDKIGMKFTPLDPQIYFEKILESKSILLAGGTMEPTDSINIVLKGFSSQYYFFNSVCQHFICLILPTGPNQISLKINYDNRSNMTMQQEIVNSIYALARTVNKGGIVIFFPSKAVLTLIRSKIIEKKLKMPVFYDNFEDYSKLIKQGTQGVIFSVMGGKLSEGTNFSDDLCRLLIIIGVPYPTVTLELEQRANYFGHDYPRIIAMKTVNQALGRALRHKDDYAAIVLLDSRYDSLLSMLTPWVKNKAKKTDFHQGCKEISVLHAECSKLSAF